MGWAQFSIPSKAFILGEYAVLKGAPALVATFAPRFELKKSPISGGSGKKFSDLSAESPARILAQSEISVLESTFIDPHGGAGGFGGSTAEFALACAAIHGADWSVTNLWKEYCRINPQASGADLAAQWAGGIVIADPKTKSVNRLAGDHLFSNCFIFSAAHQSGRKVKTHEHLEALKRTNLSQLSESEVLLSGLHAAETGNFENLARAINEYARLLKSLGFEISQTSEDRAVLRDVPGVCAVKGTGAMQADAIVVLGDPELDHAEFSKRLLPVAEKRNLRLIAAGITNEIGIST